MFLKIHAYIKTIKTHYRTVFYIIFLFYSDYHVVNLDCYYHQIIIILYVICMGCTGIVYVIPSTITFSRAYHLKFPITLTLLDICNILLKYLVFEVIGFKSNYCVKSNLGILLTISHIHNYTSFTQKECCLRARTLGKIMGNYGKNL